MHTYAEWMQEKHGLIANQKGDSNLSQGFFFSLKHQHAEGMQIPAEMVFDSMNNGTRPLLVCYPQKRYNRNSRSLRLDFSVPYWWLRCIPTRIGLVLDLSMGPMGPNSILEGRDWTWTLPPKMSHPNVMTFHQSKPNSICCDATRLWNQQILVRKR